MSENLIAIAPSYARMNTRELLLTAFQLWKSDPKLFTPQYTLKTGTQDCAVVLRFETENAWPSIMCISNVTALRDVKTEVMSVVWLVSQPWAQSAFLDLIQRLLRELQTAFTPPTAADSKPGVPVIDPLIHMLHKLQTPGADILHATMDEAESLLLDRLKEIADEQHVPTAAVTLAIGRQYKGHIDLFNNMYQPQKVYFVEEREKSLILQCRRWEDEHMGATLRLNRLGREARLRVLMDAYEQLLAAKAKKG